jgi:hypothetical protein
VTTSSHQVLLCCRKGPVGVPSTTEKRREATWLHGIENELLKGQLAPSPQVRRAVPGTLPRWGSRVRVPSSAREIGSLTSEDAEAPCVGPPCWAVTPTKLPRKLGDGTRQVWDRGAGASHFCQCLPGGPGDSGTVPREEGTSDSRFTRRGQGGGGSLTSALFTLRKLVGCPCRSHPLLDEWKRPRWQPVGGAPEHRSPDRSAEPGRRPWSTMHAWMPVACTRTGRCCRVRWRARVLAAGTGSEQHRRARWRLLSGRLSGQAGEYVPCACGRSTSSRRLGIARALG